jgi:hypothetical protein
LGGSLVVSLTNVIVSVLTRSTTAPKRPPRGRKPKDDDVIDV